MLGGDIGYIPRKYDDISVGTAISATGPHATTATTPTTATTTATTTSANTNIVISTSKASLIEELVASITPDLIPILGKYDESSSPVIEEVPRPKLPLETVISIAPPAIEIVEPQNQVKISKVALKPLSSYSLPDLQKLATESSLEIKKTGKTGNTINKTKQELYDELKQL